MIFDETQIQKARDIDLLDYLKIHAPQSIRRCGLHEYCLLAHDSFKISNGKWFWWSRGFGGKGALDYLMTVENRSFSESLEMLLGTPIEKASLSPVSSGGAAPEKKPLRLPKPARYPRQLLSYLQERGIHANLLRACLSAGILYQSLDSQSCVFVGYDKRNKARFACIRGIQNDIRRDIANSDKRYSFNLDSITKNKGKHLVVFESPIDLLSHATLQLNEKYPARWRRLSLGGTSSAALFAYLERNPGIAHVVLHLDNDRAGWTASAKIKKMLAQDRRYRHIRVSISPPKTAKDYNDRLLQSRLFGKETHTRER